MIEAIADLLACPVCRDDLELAGRIFSCPQRHTFDLNKAGYIDLVAPVGTKAPDADTPAMVSARAEFLAAGHYRPIVDALSAALATHVPALDAVADLGSGPGHYLRSLVARLPIARAVAVDLSRDAAARAARSDDRIGAVRANLKTFIPVRSGALDAAIVVFSPRNPGEWHRVLQPGGLAVVVIPTERHLRELRTSGAVIGIEQGKQERLLAEVAPFFELAGSTAVEWAFAPSVADLETLIGMGPSAFHRDRLAAAPQPRDPGPVTASVELHALRAR